MRDEQRPWLRLIPNRTVDVDVEYDQTQDRVFATYGVKIRNVGKSPAVNVFFDIRLDESRGGLDDEKFGSFEIGMALRSIDVFTKKTISPTRPQ